MRANVDRLSAQMMRAQGGGEQDMQRRQLVTALAQNNCGPQYRSAAAPPPPQNTRRQGLFGMDHPEVALGYNNIAWVQIQRGRYADADIAAGSGSGFNPAAMVDKVQLLLSDRILGTTLAPSDGGAWNYGLSLSAQWTSTMKYTVVLDRPAAFWDEVHRPQNFLTFTNAADDVAEAAAVADIQDAFA